jgi:hypothetical protein
MEACQEKKREDGRRAPSVDAGWRRAEIVELLRKQERGDAVGGVGVQHARILSEVGAPC